MLIMVLINKQIINLNNKEQLTMPVDSSIRDLTVIEIGLSVVGGLRLKVGMHTLKCLFITTYCQLISFIHAYISVG